ncbi:MAG: glycosyltransferase [Planctomycetes bacterium]|nr:glycosyltransferase [Planctomycetota bacterium]
MNLRSDEATTLAVEPAPTSHDASGVDPAHVEHQRRRRGLGRALTDAPPRAAARRSWLCVAYAFPPISRSGTHRTAGFVRHLSALGWDATVVTAEGHDDPTDAALLAGVPEATQVVRVPWEDLVAKCKRWLGRARSAEASGGRDEAKPRLRHASRDRRPWSLREWVSQLLLTPDSRSGWILPAIRAGLACARRRRPDLIYSTSPYESAHLVALALSRRLRVPWVADFRDPWHDNPFRRRRWLGLDGWDALLERMVLRRADHVVVNTSSFARCLCERFSWVASKCAVIGNGYDAELLAGVVPVRDAPAETCVLTHAGQFYGPRSPLPWLAALRRVVERRPELRQRLQMSLVGATHYDGRSLRDLALDAGVEEQVRVLGPQPHARALAYMAGSDGLLLAGSTGEGAEVQVPNKLFEYLALRRPIIAVASATGSIAEILRQSKAEAIVRAPNDVPGLADAMTRVASRELVPPADAWSGVWRFARTARAEELWRVFEQACGKRGVAG